MKKNFAAGSRVIDIRKGQERDVAALAHVAAHLLIQLILVVDRQDERPVETLLRSRDLAACVLPTGTYFSF